MTYWFQGFDFAFEPVCQSFILLFQNVPVMMWMPVAMAAIMIVIVLVGF